MRLCFHAYISKVAKVLQSNKVLKQKEKMPPNYLGFRNLVETYKLPFQGTLAEKMILWAKSNIILSPVYWLYLQSK